MAPSSKHLNFTTLFGPVALCAQVPWCGITPQATVEARTPARPWICCRWPLQPSPCRGGNTAFQPAGRLAVMVWFEGVRSLGSILFYSGSGLVAAAFSSSGPPSRPHISRLSGGRGSPQPLLEQTDVYLIVLFFWTSCWVVLAETSAPQTVIMVVVLIQDHDTQG